MSHRSVKWNTGIKEQSTATAALAHLCAKQEPDCG